MTLFFSLLFPKSLVAVLEAEQPAPSRAMVAAPVKAAAVAKREPMSRQQAVALSQERRNAGRKPRHGDGIDPMDPVIHWFRKFCLVQPLSSNPLCHLHCAYSQLSHSPKDMS